MLSVTLLKRQTDPTLLFHRWVNGEQLLHKVGEDWRGRNKNRQREQRQTEQGNTQTFVMATAQACPQISISCCCPNL